MKSLNPILIIIVISLISMTNTSKAEITEYYKIEMSPPPEVADDCDPYI